MTIGEQLVGREMAAEGKPGMEAWVVAGTHHLHLNLGDGLDSLADGSLAVLKALELSREEADEHGLGEAGAALGESLDHGDGASRLLRVLAVEEGGLESVLAAVDGEDLDSLGLDEGDDLASDGLALGDALEERGARGLLAGVLEVIDARLNSRRGDFLGLASLETESPAKEIPLVSREHRTDGKRPARGGARVCRVAGVTGEGEGAYLSSSSNVFDLGHGTFGGSLAQVFCFVSKNVPASEKTWAMPYGGFL